MLLWNFPCLSNDVSTAFVKRSDVSYINYRWLIRFRKTLYDIMQMSLLIDS